ncbi:alpha/beta fold hydrolase [Nocardia sp. NPDC058519]|uniref:alpha/beta fold hydrolase n=1 Tax=Nocardia sp. NPDC058519 TaxID=3346535 RepID=UPI00365E9960
MRLPTKVMYGIRYYDNLPDGPSDTSEIVLIHGVGTSLDFWNSVAPILAENRRTIALDLPGSGESLLPRGSYDLESVTDATIDFLDRIRVSGTVLIGHSLGALVTLQMAAKRPDLVQTLILIDPVLFDVEAVLTSPQAGLRNPALLGTTLALFAGAMIPSSISRRLLRSPRIRKQAMGMYATDPVALDVIALQDAISYVGGFRNTLRLLRVLLAAHSVDLENLAKQVGTPTVIIRGEADRMSTDADYVRLRKTMNIKNEIVLERCSHMPMLERPSDLASSILSIAE